VATSVPPFGWHLRSAISYYPVELVSSIFRRFFGFVGEELRKECHSHGKGNAAIWMDGFLAPMPFTFMREPLPPGRTDRQRLLSRRRRWSSNMRGRATA
jgi:hypothetical protein